MNKNGFVSILAVLVVVGLLIVGGGSWYYNTQLPPSITELESGTEVSSSTQTVSATAEVKNPTYPSRPVSTTTTEVKKTPPNPPNQSTHDIFLQGQDANRISDLTMFNSAMSLYLADGQTLSECIAGKVYTSNSGSRTVDGSGWLPVDFKKISSGSPFGNLPIDPTNDATFHYSFACDPSTKKYEFNASLQSYKYTEYRPVIKDDGGNNPNVYEVGNDLSIIQ